ncbi:uncharacterized protein N7511_003655 [Penicillium nucicola]|uniref:uncharacterized protein n=1 Tax=Penicillium nucicola TaxID=1850975 RepID=UPI0025452513|nr:uncharacterized protein N7511_003655 [Penicillium nucicola]KAJ5766039.1 hypothetical protein N7511_003655 [Penicillium nucicola]
MATAVVHPKARKPCYSIMDQKKFSQAIQKSIQKTPGGSNPKIGYKAPVSHEDTLKGISFYATSGCHGDGGGAVVDVLRSDFTGNDKLCSTSKNVKGGRDDLEGDGASMIIDGNIGSLCQLHFYKSLGCANDDTDWLGFMSSTDQISTCGSATNSDGKTITGMRSFKYVCAASN